ncbi:MAG: mandelate racemase/muconate lactonizing enzyme family protein [Pollutimonas bauzanensis]|uniref:L-alanine-DL-glutamate epimerase n=1 Tax=Pollutimonas bauzanensis TaxID=658167 RepID=A0A1M5SJN0_9BURK|nr:mandelate racemase/muconate lactonizing enzyme family protein [Pollutimonas bauzanensis]SHH38701.1 L-alanine-DL-glutamate epimerase [Pollutimonas bauzanensis]
MKIADIQSYPISFPVPAEHSVTLSIGRTVKRDAVLVRVETDEGLVGWGEAHHGRCPGAVSRVVDTTLRDLVLGRDALDVVGVWEHVYKKQLASHGVGAAASMALSGLDCALWDIRAQAVQWPLYRLLGGASKPIKAYAGGISLGWQAPELLAEEAQALVAQGYRAMKLRMGDRPDRDIMRVRAVRLAVGPDIDILLDANTGYTVEDVRKVMPAFEEMQAGWLEEPFPPHDRRSYAQGAALGKVPFAAGENHFTRFDFNTLIEDGNVRYLQPDMSKTGGITEGLRIAAMASAQKLSVNPHTSTTAPNMAATIHYMCAIENPGYFEADVTALNPFRDALGGRAPYELDSGGFVHAYDDISTGLAIDVAFLKAHPLMDGPCYV